MAESGAYLLFLALLALILLLTNLLLVREHRRNNPVIRPKTVFLDNWLLYVGVASVVTFCATRRFRQLWRLTRKVRRFGTAAHGRIILHYAPELMDQGDIPILLQACLAEVDSLADQFGFRPRRRIVVFVFARSQDIGRIFGPLYGGTALSLSNAIFIPHDRNLQEVMRHELAHLFAFRWNQAAPPLLSEGLATWLEDTEEGKRIDAAACHYLRNANLKLALLWKRNFFFSEPHRHACYMLAGSFTGFLLGRFGWRPYRRFYWLCNGLRFRAQFKKCFGVSLEEAEAEWRHAALGNRC